MDSPENTKIYLELGNKMKINNQDLYALADFCSAQIIYLHEKVNNQKDDVKSNVYKYVRLLPGFALCSMDTFSSPSTVISVSPSLSHHLFVYLYRFIYLLIHLY